MVDASKSGGVSAVVEYDYTAKEPDELDLVKGAIIHDIKQMPGGWWEGTIQTNGKTGMFPDNFVRIVDMSEDNTVVLRDKTTTSNRRCKVIYSYTQVNDDELSLAVGDVIEFLGEVEEGWWRGRLKNKIGVFPSNFVKLIESSPVFASKRPPSTAKTITASNNLMSVSVAKNANTVAAASSSNISASSTAASSSSSATKKINRLSFHNSKEDLLNSSNTTTTTLNATVAAAAASTTATTIPGMDDAAPSLPPKPLRDYCRVEFPYAPQNDDELELKVGDIITIHSMELPDKGWWKGEIRGKVGVFPDNFVKLMAPTEVSPLNDSQHQQQQQQSQPQQTHRTTAKLSNTTTTTNNNTTNVKSLIKKSGSSSSTQSSNRKDSFGSRDSLNDILSETGLPTGNVAAQRKSLENKNFDLSNASDGASSRLALKKQQQLQQESKTIANITSSSNTAAATTSTNLISATSSSDLRKSIENMDDKPKTTPPPVLNKKPSVPVKKTTTVTSITGNILSGIKQKVKNVENKLTTAASHDYADGVGSSKLSQSPVAESGTTGVVMRRAATIAVEDTDFDRVERGSILPDMRAGRVKAPKRRPPSAAIGGFGESNNNSLYVNGNGNGSDTTQSGDDQLKSDDNSTGEEQLAKPKPREWEKKKAPWMEELKMSQVKKKTSPSVADGSSSVTERNSKLFGDDIKITNNSSSQQQQVSSSTLTNNSSTSSSSTTLTTKVQSSSVSSTSIMQQSMLVESSSSSNSNATAKTLTEAMTKSLSAKIVNDTAANNVTASFNNSNNTSLSTTNTTSSSSANTTNTVDDVRARPNSLSIRNRSASPSMAATRNILKSNTTSSTTTSASPAANTTAEASSSSNLHNSNNLHSTVAKSAATNISTSSVNNSSAAIVNNHHHHHPHNGGSSGSGSTTTKVEGNRVAELETRVDKLEMLVHSQQRTIDELVRTLREETDRNKVLRSELDKYAQCVTQV